MRVIAFCIVICTASFPYSSEAQLWKQMRYEFAYKVNITAFGMNYNHLPQKDKGRMLIDRSTPGFSLPFL